MDPSTIACSLYNMLALGPCTLEEARLRASRVGCLLSLEDLRQAAEDLLRLSRIAVVDAVVGVYRVRGPEGMVVTKRDREDAWNRWELSPVADQLKRQIVGTVQPTLLDDMLGGL